jgi:hypothetical protein
MKALKVIKQSPYKLLCFRSIWRAGLAPAVVLSFLGAATLQAQTISDNFNDRTDSGAQGTWTHYDLSSFVGYGNATFTFPTNPAGPAGNYAYKIQAASTGSDPDYIMNARAASYRSDAQYGGSPYSARFLVGVDLVDWDPSLEEDVGMLFMVQPTTNITPGSADGYAATYENSSSTLYISSLTSEVPSTAGETDGITFDPTRQYRLVVSTHDGSTLLLTVFDTSEPNSPWVSVIAPNTAYPNTPGICGLYVYQENYPSSDGADATFDNYLSTVPAAGAMPATVTDLSPPPAGKATAIYPMVTVGILNRDTTVKAASIQLWLDGVQIPSSLLTIDPNYVYKPNNPSASGTSFPGATVTYSNTTLYTVGTGHTNAIVFTDSNGTLQSNAWTWTSAYPFLYASNSLPIGSLSLPGFDARMVQSSAANIAGSVSPSIPNSVASAEAVLAYQYAVDLAATSVVQSVAWDLDATNNGAITNFPGLCIPPANVNSFAVQALTYLQLTNGLNTFYVDSDDTVGIFSGTNLTDTSNVVLETTGVAHQSFEFFVEADGLYPFNIIYEQGTGSAYLVLHSVNPDNSQTLLNAPGGVPAFYPLVVKSCTSVEGPYTADAAANAANALKTVNLYCDGNTNNAALNQSLTGGTVTVPISGTAKFYLLDGPRAAKIPSVKKAGSNLVINYTYR